MSRTKAEISADRATLTHEKGILEARLVGCKAHLDTFDDPRESPKIFEESKDVEQRIKEIDKALKDLHEEEKARLEEHRTLNPGKHHRKGG